MTITIDLDVNTTHRLETEAALAGISLEQHVAAVLSRGSSSIESHPLDVKPNLGFAAGRGIWISPDFDEPMEEFQDYV